MISKSDYRPRVYYAAIFLGTYAFWFCGAYASHREELQRLYMLLMLPGLLMPFLVSLVMILTSKNRQLRKDFFHRLTDWRLINLKTLPVFFLLMPLAVILSIFLSLLFGESISQLRLAAGFSFSTGFVPVLLLLLLAAAFEELGWRGYAFDSLQSRYNYLTAAILFSILWSLWHFPLVFVKDSYQYEIVHQNFWFGVNFFIGIIPMGIIISWICAKNRKSVAAAILFHFIVNLSQEFLAITQKTKCVETFVLLAIAIGVVKFDKQVFFSQAPGAAGN